MKSKQETEMRLLFNEEENCICLVDNNIEELSINGEALKLPIIVFSIGLLIGIWGIFNKHKADNL